MTPEVIENIIKAFTPLALAAAWIYTQIKSKKTEDNKEKIDIAERERQYSERTEARLRKAQEELENVMKELGTQEKPEVVLKEVVDKDPGLMFIKKRVAPKVFVYLKVSPGFAVTYLGGPSEIIENNSENLLGWNFAESDENIFTSQTGRVIREAVYSPLTGVKGTFVGRKFPLVFGTNHYIVGVGDHEFDKEA